MRPKLIVVIIILAVAGLSRQTDDRRTAQESNTGTGQEDKQDEERKEQQQQNLDSQENNGNTNRQTENDEDKEGESKKDEDKEGESENEENEHDNKDLPSGEAKKTQTNSNEADKSPTNSKDADKSQTNSKKADSSQENTNNKRECSDECSDCHYSPKCSAFDGSTKQMTFHQNFFAYLKKLKDEKGKQKGKLDELLEKFVQKLNDMVVNNLGKFDPKASCSHIRMLFLKYVPLKPLDFLGKTKEFAADIVNIVSGRDQSVSGNSRWIWKTINFLRVFSEDTLNTMMKTPIMSKVMCNHFIAYRLGCRHTNFALKAMKSAGKSCLEYETTNPRAAFLSFIVKHGEPTKWKVKEWKEFFNWGGNKLYRTFANSNYLYQALIASKEFLIKMSKHIQKTCPLMRRTKQQAFISYLKLVLKRMKEGEDKKKENDEESREEEIMEMIKKCDGDLSDIATCKEQLNQYKRGDATHMNLRRRAKCRWTLFKIKNCKDFTADDIVRYFPLLTPKAFHCFKIEELKKAICDLSPDEQRTRGTYYATVVLRKNRKTMSTLETKDIKCWKNLLSKLRESEIKNIKDDVIIESLDAGYLKDIKFKCKIAKIIKRIYESKVVSHRKKRSLASPQLQKFGRMLACFDKSDWEKIKPNEITDEVIVVLAKASEGMKRWAVDKQAVAAFMEKVKGKEGALKKIVESGLFKLLHFKSAVDMGKFIGELLKDEDIQVMIEEKIKDKDPIIKGIINCKCTQTRGCWNGLQTVINFTVTEEASQFISYLENSNILSGMSLHPSILGKYKEWLCEKTPQFFKSSCLRNKLYDEIQKTCDMEESCSSLKTEEDENLDISTISLFSKKSSFFNTCTQEKKKQICDNLGSADISVCHVPSYQIRQKLNLCSHCKKDVTHDKYSSCKSLLCELHPNEFKEALKKDTLKEHMSELCETCYWSTGDKKELVNLAKELEVVSSPGNFTTEDIATLGSCIKSLRTEDKKQIPQDILLEGKEYVDDSIEKEQEMIRTKEKCGLKERPQEAQKRKQQDKEYGAMIAAAVMIHKDKMKRKRRSTEFSLTCDMLQEIGSYGITALTVEQLASLSDQDVKDCLGMLGALESWDTEQKKGLINIMKRVYRTCNGWEPERLVEAGYILQGITAEDIGMLQLNLDAISKLGEYDGWSEIQKLEMFKQFLRYYKNTGDASDLTDEELRLLGHFTCGMTTDQIASIHHSTYKNASDDIGQVTSCNEAQLVQWAKVAKKAYGDDVSKWDMATIESVGTVIGGLDKDDITKLNEDQIDAIHASHIRYIPPSTMQKFTAEQLRLFSSLQAQAITSAQIQALSPQQISVLEVLVGKISDAPSNQNIKRLGGSFDSGNGCDTVSVDWKTVGVVMLSGIRLLIN